MTLQEYQLMKLQLATLKSKLHKRFIYADAIAFAKTLLAVEKYEHKQREKRAEGFGG